MTSADEAAASISELGEDAVLAVIREVVDTHNAAVNSSELVIGPGDDAAVLAFRAGVGTVVTTDTMSQDQDFRLTWWKNPEAAALDIGIKAAAQNLSDLNAMGASPTALLVSLTLPAQTSVGWVRQVYRGISRACQGPGAHGCSIIGGDLGSGEGISVTITAIGSVPGTGTALLRSGARVGDQLACAGRLGASAAGLAILERPASPVSEGERKMWAKHRDTFRLCLDAQTRPAPPMHAGQAALSQGATAGLDVSDGLLRDAERLGRASGVQVVLDEDRVNALAEDLIPVARALGFGTGTAVDWVLNGGEDFALLATFGADAELPEGFQLVGHVEEGAPGAMTRLQAGRDGWDSLRAQSAAPTGPVAGAPDAQPAPATANSRAAQG